MDNLLTRRRQARQAVEDWKRRRDLRPMRVIGTVQHSDRRYLVMENGEWRRG